MAENAPFLNANAFPPGSSRSFIDALLRQYQASQDTGKKTDDNATQLTQVQKAVNELSSALESTTATAKTALSTANTAANDAAAALRAANNAGNGVGDINMNAVFKNTTATQTVGGAFGAARYLVGGVQVVGGRMGGWTGTSGAEQRGGLNADQGFNVGGPYSQQEVLAIAAGLVEVRKVVNSLCNLVISHGLAGA